MVGACIRSDALSSAGQARIEALIKYRREKIRQQKANVIRAWLTEEEMAKEKWSPRGPYSLDSLCMLSNARSIYSNDVHEY